MAKDGLVRRKPIYAFIDASNLFYGGEKSLGWKIDYKKLLEASWRVVDFQGQKMFLLRRNRSLWF